MPLYVAESYYFTLEHGGHESNGVVGQGGGSEKIYLHVIEVSEEELRALSTRVDEHGNKQHDRICLPDREDWWIAIEGEKVWPGTLRPRITSKCTIPASGPARPIALGEAELAELRRVKASLPK